MIDIVLAAALAVDLENPVFSNSRARLLQLVPAQFTFKPLAAGATPTEVPHDAATDRLTSDVIQRLESSPPAAGTPESEFLGLLKATDAVAELRARVVAEHERLKASLSSNRMAALKSLYGRVVARRQAMLEHPTLRRLDETNGRLLFPSGPPP